MVVETEGSKYSIGTVHYSNDARGLLTCYLMGLSFVGKDAPPLGFTGNLLAGDLFFTALLFGAHAWLSRRAAAPRAPKKAMPQAAGAGGQAGPQHPPRLTPRPCPLSPKPRPPFCPPPTVGPAQT